MIRFAVFCTLLLLWPAVDAAAQEKCIVFDIVQGPLGGQAYLVTDSTSVVRGSELAYAQRLWYEGDATGVRALCHARIYQFFDVVAHTDPDNPNRLLTLEQYRYRAERLSQAVITSPRDVGLHYVDSRKALDSLLLGTPPLVVLDTHWVVMRLPEPALQEGTYWWYAEDDSSGAERQPLPERYGAIGLHGGLLRSPHASPVVEHRGVLWRHDARGDAQPMSDALIMVPDHETLLEDVERLLALLKKEGADDREAQAAEVQTLIEFQYGRVSNEALRDWLERYVYQYAQDH